MNPKAATVLSAALFAGFGGWVLENALFAPPPRDSSHLPHVPFLPVYAAGGAVIAVLSPRLASWHPLGRGLAYGAVLAGVEGLSGYAERIIDGRRSWDYDGVPVDLPHAAMWGILALGVDYLLQPRKE